MNKIINPQNGLEYDLFSQEGLNILNMFIRTYKNGGAKSRKRTNRKYLEIIHLKKKKKKNR